MEALNLLLVMLSIWCSVYQSFYLYLMRVDAIDSDSLERNWKASHVETQVEG